MTSLKRNLSTVGILAGATIGAGVFTLPYIASRAGLLPFVVYLIVLGVFIAGAHLLYWRVLDKNPDTASLVGLSRKYFGPGMERLAFVVILLGLIFTLSIYLLLGGRFLARVFELQPDISTLLFWLAVSIPLAFNLRRFVRIELFISALMVFAALALVFTQHISFHALPLATHTDLFLPFAPILFALAGWTALEPMASRYRQSRQLGERQMSPGKLLALGTAGIGILYVLFIVGIASVSSTVTSDTFAGLGPVPPWYLVLLFMFGLSAIVTSYLPMSLEIKNSLVLDLKWPRSLAVTGVLFLPYLLILSGLNNFVILIELVGGMFLATQYLILLFVARRALQLHGMRRLALDVVAAAFFLAIAYQFYYLLV